MSPVYSPGASVTPEHISQQIYEGLGSATLWDFANAWAQVSTKFYELAAQCDTLTERWILGFLQSEAGTTIATAAASYAHMLRTTAGIARQASAQSATMARAFDSTKSAVASPQAIEANRRHREWLTSAEIIISQKSALIAECDAEYDIIWAQNISAMEFYHREFMKVQGQQHSWPEFEANSRNYGSGNTGSRNLGGGNTGFDNVGWGNFGYRNIGAGNYGTGNWGVSNKGNNNIGFGITGDNRVGFGWLNLDIRNGTWEFGGGWLKLNTGHNNWGLGNTGNNNVGFFNSGNNNVGVLNSSNNIRGIGNSHPSICGSTPTGDTITPHQPPHHPLVTADNGVPTTSLLAASHDHPFPDLTQLSPAGGELPRNTSQSSLISLDDQNFVIIHDDVSSDNDFLRFFPNGDHNNDLHLPTNDDLSSRRTSLSSTSALIDDSLFTNPSLIPATTDDHMLSLSSGQPSSFATSSINTVIPANNEHLSFNDPLSDSMTSPSTPLSPPLPPPPPFSSLPPSLSNDLPTPPPSNNSVHLGEATLNHQDLNEFSATSSPATSNDLPSSGLTQTPQASGGSLNDTASLAPNEQTTFNLSQSDNNPPPPPSHNPVHLEQAEPNTQNLSSAPPPPPPPPPLPPPPPPAPDLTHMKGAQGMHASPGHKSLMEAIASKNAERGNFVDPLAGKTSDPKNALLNAIRKAGEKSAAQNSGGYEDPLKAIAERKAADAAAEKAAIRKAASPNTGSLNTASPRSLSFKEQMEAALEARKAVLCSSQESVLSPTQSEESLDWLDGGQRRQSRAAEWP